MDMELNSANVQAVVRQVLESMMGQTAVTGAPAPAASIPKTAHVAMLTSLEHLSLIHISEPTRPEP